jgi:hypothetical protein
MEIVYVLAALFMTFGTVFFSLNCCCAMAALWILQHIVCILFDNRFGVIFRGRKIVQTVFVSYLVVRMSVCAVGMFG